MTKEKQPAVKVKIEKNRVYQEDMTSEGYPIMRVVSPTEYAVMRGDEVLARIVKASNGWRAVVPTEQSRLGTPVSPVGLNRFSRVRKWALDKWGGAGKRRRLINA
jgi:hypothetical protein